MSDNTEKTKVQVNVSDEAEAIPAKAPAHTEPAKLLDQAEKNAYAPADNVEKPAQAQTVVEIQAPQAEAVPANLLDTIEKSAKPPENKTEKAPGQEEKTADEVQAPQAEAVVIDPPFAAVQYPPITIEKEPAATQELPPGASKSKDDTLVQSGKPVTRKLPEPQDILRTARYGEAVLGERAKLNIVLRGIEADPIEIEVEEDFVIGRASIETSENPDLDLFPYGAVDKGVSRQHLVIMKRGDTLHVMDMESTNGTYLNGVWMYPKQPRVLRDGDELMLGSLVLQVKFIWQEI